MKTRAVCDTPKLPPSLIHCVDRSARYNRAGLPVGPKASASPFTSAFVHPGILKFYTDDAPGLRIGPTVVLVFSLVFIGCVVLLHIWGKFQG